MNDWNLFEFCFRRSSWCPGLEPIITPSKFRTASFPSATSSKGLLRERFQGTVPPTPLNEYPTLFRSVRLSDLDDSLAGLVQFAQRAVRRIFVDVA